jgi:hypothetical protein
MCIYYLFIYLYSLPPIENWVAQSMLWLGYKLRERRVLVWFVVGTEVFLCVIMSKVDLGTT